MRIDMILGKPFSVSWVIVKPIDLQVVCYLDKHHGSWRHYRYAIFSESSYYSGRVTEYLAERRHPKKRTAATTPMADAKKYGTAKLPTVP